jgi:hypothetical protein
LLPSILAQDDLRAGRVIPALAQKVRSAGDYYLPGRKSLRDRHKIKIYRLWLHAETKTADTIMT